MIAGVPPLDLFGVLLTVESIDRRAAPPVAVLRCEVVADRLKAAGPVRMSDADTSSLLQQVEQQYADFTRSVAWSTSEDQDRLEVAWNLNGNGHAEGRYELRSAGWRIEATLDGDQSYLPKLALGLRLLLRLLRGEPL